MISICFIWIGFIAAISFMESWLKFKAPGVNLATGLSIGRLVFKVLNRIEWTFFLLLVIFGFLSGIFSADGIFIQELCTALAVILLVQTIWLLPKMDNRAVKAINGEKLDKSKLHIYYVGLELIKMALLISVGVILF